MLSEDVIIAESLNVSISKVALGEQTEYYHNKINAAMSKKSIVTILIKKLADDRNHPAAPADGLTTKKKVQHILKQNNLLISQNADLFKTMNTLASQVGELLKSSTTVLSSNKKSFAEIVGNSIQTPAAQVSIIPEIGCWSSSVFHRFTQGGLRSCYWRLLSCRIDVLLSYRASI
uniref:Uncharacterized protein n=1 Tax=Caenorhabditis japonica TaxID=281687 RepID=A0A8R1I209_CAEJA